MDYSTPPPIPLGEMLLSKRILDAESLSSVMGIHAKTRQPIGKIILSEGIGTPMEIYQALAEQHYLPFVNLITAPPQESLLEVRDINAYLMLEAIPYHKSEHGLTIATTSITDRLQHWCTERFGEENISFVITSPLDIKRTVETYFGAHLDKFSRLALFEALPEYSAKVMAHKPQQRMGLLILLMLAALCLISVSSTLLAVVITAQLFYLFTLLFKSLLFVTGANHSSKPPRLTLADDALPVYTILVPLYKEAESLPRLFAALAAIDYPKSKLDIKLILEADDTETYEAAIALKPSGTIDIIRVPYSLPRTKPKACNYALRFAKGDIVTIYDAEDRPEPLQLRKAAQLFHDSPKEVVCLQARLNYYNKNENLLTRLFSIEYAAWFDYMLKGLQAFSIPIPLGGTSNHIALAKLREVGEWDPYNVTEDADLGIRLALSGYKTRLLESITLEEAPITLSAWMKQRSRWIKGYLQTWLVHMRSPRTLLKEFGLKGFIGFQLFIGGPCLVFVLAPLLWIISLLWMLDIIVPDATLPFWFIGLAVGNLLAGIIIHYAFAAYVVTQKGWKKMAVALFAFPFYWILHSLASFKALWQLVMRPHYWEKTTHNLSRLTYARNNDVFEEFG